MPYRKKPRLADFPYVGPYAYSVTIRTGDNVANFADSAPVEEVRNILFDAASAQRFAIFAYCFMPDHFHLLVIGEEASSLKLFVNLFKQKSGYFFKHKYQRRLWQPSYYDHIMRRDEDLTAAAKYILNNPVRKGLPEDRGKEPFCGSQVFDPEE